MRQQGYLLCLCSFYRFRPSTELRRRHVWSVTLGAHMRSDMALILRLEPRLEHDHCGTHGAARGEGIEVLVDLSPSVPETLTLCAVCSPGGDLARAVDEVDRDVGMSLEVKPPSRFGVAPTVHGHGDEIRAVFVVAHHHGVRSARSPPDRGKAHGAPTAGLRSPQTEPTTGPPVQAAMGDPKKPDEPARRKSYLLDLWVRHVLELSPLITSTL